MTLTLKRSPPRARDRNSDLELARSLFDDLRRATSDGKGISRVAYSDRETAALDVIAAKARELGLHKGRDAGSNLVITLEGSDPALPFIACGSHLDSVPQGGNFDGAAGVVAGLAVLAGFLNEDLRPRRTVKVYGLRGEESARFGRAYIGSRSLLGQLPPGELALPAGDTGRSLGDCMRDVGVDVDRVARGQPLIDAKAVAAWLELHIEQGPVLEARTLPIGIVQGIRGNVRHRTIACIGQAGHSGAVPRWLRHDAVFAAAELISRLDEHWRRFLEQGQDLVVTSGIFGTEAEEQAIARIPGLVSFSIDFRSHSRETLESFYELFQRECDRIGDERGVHFRLDTRSDTPGAILDRVWIERLKAAAREHGLEDEEIPSGGGHDAAVFANAGIPSAMVFVRNANGSHNPSEAMDLDDFVHGVAVMRTAISKVIQ
ncbi:hydantoinase/carbamoylase family amidase [Xanthobacter aminoxidans]|uniref:hydantoinase/carbamoylase family amidase n=1 Tax=Xanthobacter aminoxidans TaxID=186280 RepID=UPI0037263154